MKLDQTLVNAAIDFLERRFPGKAWAGAAAMYTDRGEILVSTAPDTVNESVSLCHETGAICEAHKTNQKITASVCVS
jgi:cytidine deaminase